MQIQEIKQGMKVRNAGGDVFEIMGTKGGFVIVKMLDHNGDGFAVNYLHETIIPGKVIEIDQTYSIDMIADGYYEVALEYLEPVEEVEGIEESDVPIFLVGDLVKDAFGNTFEVAEAKPSQRLDPDRFDYCNMGYRLKLVTKNPQSPIREVHDDVKFVEEGIKFWVFNREEDARAVEEYNPYTITASELVLVRSVLQTKQATPATPAKAERSKRPSIQELRKLSEEYDPENLLDEAYQILEEQARLGERRANLTGKFKNCIQHFKREGFDVLEHGMLIGISW